MTSQCYKSAVKETFETKPLKTVLMIDDQFPTFADLADLVDERGNASEPRFRQKDRALALYRGFQKRHMICDVETTSPVSRQNALEKATSSSSITTWVRENTTTNAQ